MVAKIFVDTYLESNFSDETKAVVQSIGLPTGLLSSMNLSEEVFSLTRDAEYMFYSSYSWSSKLNLYHPAVYLIPGSFTNCDPESSFDTIVQNAKYFISNSSYCILFDANYLFTISIYFSITNYYSLLAS